MVGIFAHFGLVGILAEELIKDVRFQEVSSIDFYRDIFKNDLDDKDAMTKGKYTGIAVEIVDENK